MKARDVGLAVICGAVPVIVMLKGPLVAVVWQLVLVAVKVKLNVPGRVGVPILEEPPSGMLNPLGSAPAETLTETGEEIAPHVFALTVLIVC